MKYIEKNYQNMCKTSALKSMQKEIKEHKKLSNISSLLTGIFNIICVSVAPKLIYKLSVVPLKSSNR